MAGEIETYETTPENRKKAERFFELAKVKAEAAQFEYAIDLYLQGLAFDPEAVVAHQAVREISLVRKARGGKDLGMFEKMKIKNIKEDYKTNMVNAEKKLAYDPGNTGNMLDVLQNASKGTFVQTVLWISPILQRANFEHGTKADVNKYFAIRDAYVKIRQWKLAADAVQYALQLRPNDMDLQGELKNLGAQQTLTESGYEKGGSFMSSVRDAEAQQRLMREDTDVRTVDAMTQAIQEARNAITRNPQDLALVGKLVDLLTKTEDGDLENEAIELLDKTYKTTGQFRYRQSLGKIRLAQLRRMEKSMRQQATANPGDKQLAADYASFRREQWEEEYKEFALALENYPTDSVLRYEMSSRLFLLGRPMEAIPLLQQVMQDPKLKVDATVMLGRAFLQSDFLDESVDTLKGMADTYQIAGDTKAKEIWYWYGRALEQRKNDDDAIKCYSKIAMWEFTYRDVQDRLKNLRNKAKQNQ